jgi:succinate dehydrogenase/fumarate reductase flavoprotein subunit
MTDEYSASDHEASKKTEHLEELYTESEFTDYAMLHALYSQALKHKTTFFIEYFAFDLMTE